MVDGGNTDANLMKNILQQLTPAVLLATKQYSTSRENRATLCCLLDDHLVEVAPNEPNMMTLMFNYQSSKSNIMCIDKLNIPRRQVPW